MPLAGIRKCGRPSAGIAGEYDWQRHADDRHRRLGRERLTHELAGRPHFVHEAEEGDPLVPELGQLPEPVADRIPMPEVGAALVRGKPAHVVGIQVHEVEGMGIVADEAAGIGRVLLAQARHDVVERDRYPRRLERSDAAARRFAHPAFRVEVAGDVDAEWGGLDEARHAGLTA